jgi:hypothetical protein
MLPRWHIFYGALFTGVVWFVAQQTAWYNLLLIFLASVFIDLDHYVNAVRYTKTLSFRNALRYYDKVGSQLEIKHKKGMRDKEHEFQFFHTIEFIFLVAILGIFWAPLFYVFIGLVFHLLLDVYYLISKDYIYVREWFFFNWMRKQF